MNRTISGYLLVLGSAVCFALMGILVKSMYALGLSPWQAAELQSLAATSLLLTGSIIVRPGLLRVGNRQMLRLAVQGIGGSLLTSICIFQALARLSASLSILLLFTYPSLVTIGSLIFFRQKLTPSRGLSLGLAAAGTALAAGFLPIGHLNASLSGIGFALAAAVAYSFYILYGEVNLGSSDPWTATVFTQSFSTLGLIILQPPWRLFAGGVSGPAAGYGLLTAVLCSIIPFYLLLRGISLIGASRASIVSTAELPLTVALAWLLLEESVTPWNIAGGLLILASIVLLHREKTDTEQAETAAAAG